MYIKFRQTNKRGDLAFEELSDVVQTVEVTRYGWSLNYSKTPGISSFYDTFVVTIYWTRTSDLFTPGGLVSGRIEVQRETTGQRRLGRVFPLLYLTQPSSLFLDPRGRMFLCCPRILSITTPFAVSLSPTPSLCSPFPSYLRKGRR